MSDQDDHIAHLAAIQAEMQSEHHRLLHDALHPSADRVASSFEALEDVERMIAVERAKAPRAPMQVRGSGR